LADEVPTLTFLERHYKEKHFVLPCVVGDDLELRQYTGPEDLEIKGKFHIPEPVGPLFTDYASIQLALIPGMAFDGEGHRLGRGKGYYDRFLSHPAFTKIPKVGLCFDFQLVPSVPCESHDLPMDQVLVLPTV